MATPKENASLEEEKSIETSQTLLQDDEPLNYVSCERGKKKKAHTIFYTNEKA